MTAIRTALSSWVVWLLLGASAAGFVVLVVTDRSGIAHASPHRGPSLPRHGPSPLADWRGQIAVAVAATGADPTLVEVATPERPDPTVVFRAPSNQAVRDLAWSPDGGRLAIVVGSPLGAGHIDVMDVTGGALTAVAVGRGRTSTSVAWSPDGRLLAYDLGRTTQPGLGSAIVVSRPDGSHRRVVTPGHENAVAPAWSPDGRRIAYVSAITAAAFADREGAVVVVPAGGGSPRKVSGGYDGYDPTWAPNSRTVYFAADWSGGQGLVEVATRPRGRVVLAFDCTAELRCETVGSPTFGPGGGELGFLVAVDHPGRSLVSVVRHGSTTDSLPVLRFPLYTCCMTWWRPPPGQSSV
jgi:WD40-like Beta Propeller Repeat